LKSIFRIFEIVSGEIKFKEIFIFFEILNIGEIFKGKIEVNHAGRVNKRR